MVVHLEPRDFVVLSTANSRAYTCTRCPPVQLVCHLLVHTPPRHGEPGAITTLLLLHLQSISSWPRPSGQNVISFIEVKHLLAILLEFHYGCAPPPSHSQLAYNIIILSSAVCDALQIKAVLIYGTLAFTQTMHVRRAATCCPLLC